MMDAATITRISFLKWLAQEDQARRARYADYREYYDGQHDTQLSERMSHFLQVKTAQQFNSNYCPIVVDAKAERLNVTGFTTDSEDIAELCWDWWQRQRMDAQQVVIHTAAIRDGDAYVLVGWDNEAEQPEFSFELAYDGSEGVDVRYDPNNRGEVLYAIKKWRVGAENPEDAGYKRRINVYYPDRIEKYTSDERNGASGDWEPYEEPGQPWPMPWENDRGEPLGVPVIPFRNNSQGYDYGQSELINVIPIQNALNKAIIDLLAAADTSAFRIYFASGDSFSDFSITPGTLIQSSNSDANMRAIEMGDLSPLITLKDSLAKEIARITRTPAHYFQISGQRAAEGTLKQEEQGLISRVERSQVAFGNSWEDVMHMALKLADTYGGVTVPDDIFLSTQWAEAATHDEKAQIEIAEAKARLGVPQEQLWAEMGYSPDEIEAMKDTDEYRARRTLMTLNSAEEMNG